ncbi:MAG: class I SAM-dependent methyltransferase [Desulfobacteraceae bacterium]|jgi:SAM-dependent methyltransferase|nr:class I SAM-dependent methyltransferase [Desulfobacteraceae bacterium]
MTFFICPGCNRESGTIFHEQTGVPVHSVLNMKTREAAVAFQRGDLRLAHCANCGFIWNAAFDPTLMAYSSDCEESQGFSPTFNAFAKALAEDLISRHDLKGKTIIEIGCGKGEFLTLLCQLGNNKGIGFDPAYVERRDGQAKDGNIVFIQDYYSEKYQSYRADFFCCRMTLEHIPDTGAFIRSVRKAVGDRKNAFVFFQVPDVTRILRDCAFEDIYYEHCSYFSPESLSALFSMNSFHVVDVRTAYDGQYLLLEAVPTDHGKCHLEKNGHEVVIAELVSEFAHKLDRKTAWWRQFLNRMKTETRRTVIWGSGSKGVSFLTTLQVKDEIEFAVDINPYRQGTFMAGTGQRIVAPAFLKDYRPDCVIVMNAVYREEIERDLHQMRLHPKVMTL